jgi:hypothetical protein
MATASQQHQPSFFDDRNYVEVAQRRFPHSFKHGKVRGTGRFALVSKCIVPWRVFLFASAQQRAEAIDRWGWNGCGAVRCTHDHRSEDLQ